MHVVWLRSGRVGGIETIQGGGEKATPYEKPFFIGCFIGVLVKKQ
jgi:hypothetical protein